MTEDPERQQQQQQQNKHEKKQYEKEQQQQRDIEHPQLKLLFETFDERAKILHQQGQVKIFPVDNKQSPSKNFVIVVVVVVVVVVFIAKVYLLI